MPKLKTKRSAVKRFRMTGTGKIKAGSVGRRHNLSLGKDRKRKRTLRGRIRQPAVKGASPAAKLIQRRRRNDQSSHPCGSPDPRPRGP